MKKITLAIAFLFVSSCFAMQEKKRKERQEKKVQKFESSSEHKEFKRTIWECFITKKTREILLLTAVIDTALAQHIEQHAQDDKPITAVSKDNGKKETFDLQDHIQRTKEAAKITTKQALNLKNKLCEGSYLNTLYECTSFQLKSGNTLVELVGRFGIITDQENKKKSDELVSMLKRLLCCVEDLKELDSTDKGPNMVGIILGESIRKKKNDSPVDINDELNKRLELVLNLEIEEKEHSLFEKA